MIQILATIVVTVLVTLTLGAWWLVRSARKSFESKLKTGMGL